MTTLRPGEPIGDRYVVEQLIGEGGIARVYRVNHRTLGSTHALKILSMPASMLADRMLQEGRIQAQLRHPNLVAVTDIVEYDGQMGLVMEYVSGPTLRHLIATNGPLRVDEGLGLFSQILAGVAAAHSVGVLHRDLKPENILLQEATGGVVAKVSDFGIAKAAGGGLRDGTTRVGVQLGTPGYMAPEQIAETDAVDQRADIFALGAILYEMLSGRRALAQASTFESLQQVAEGRVAALDELVPDLPAGLASAVHRALAFSPANRFADCDALADAVFANHSHLRAAMRSSARPAGRGSLFTPLAAEQVASASPQSPTMVPDIEATPARGPADFTLSRTTRHDPVPPAQARRRQIRWPAILVGCAGLLVALGWGVALQLDGATPPPAPVQELAGEPNPLSNPVLAEGPGGAATTPTSPAPASTGSPSTSSASTGSLSTASPGVRPAVTAPPVVGPEPDAGRRQSADTPLPPHPAAASGLPTATGPASEGPTPSRPEDAPAAPTTTDRAMIEAPPEVQDPPPDRAVDGALTPEPSPTPTAISSKSLQGTWTGVAGGNPLAIRLTAQKGNAIAGTVTIRVGANARTAGVRGTFEPATGTLELSESGGSKLWLRGNVAGETMNGTFARQGSSSSSPWSAARD